MGFFDTLKCEVDVPGMGVPAETTFQTKSVYCTNAAFTITKEGRLVEQKFSYVPVEINNNEFPHSRAIPNGVVDLDYHGDILFCGGESRDSFCEYVARFTDGKLVWIKSLSDISAIHKSRLEMSYR